jgi:hypothetical protein
MNVGLLTNPHKYKEEFMKDKKMIKELTKKTLKLEKQVELQKRVIDVMRVSPGKKMGGKIKDGLFQRGQKESKSKLKKLAPREAESSGKGVIYNESDSSQLEESQVIQ